MKRQTGLMYKIGAAVMVVALSALACSILPSAEKPTPTAVVKHATATKAPAPTHPPKATPTDVPAVQDTEAAPTDAPIPLDTAVPGPDESWRISPYKGATLSAYDQSPNLDPNWVSAMDKQARNLAIPKPYYFEVYDQPARTSFVNIRDYYDEQITQNGGMKKAQDYTGSNGIALASWVGTSVKNRKYLVQYFPADSKYPPMMFIMYSNPGD